MAGSSRAFYLDASTVSPLEKKLCRSWKKLPPSAGLVPSYERCNGRAIQRLACAEVVAKPFSRKVEGQLLLSVSITEGGSCS